jgi:RNA polymerase sigma factor (sigma-70 family)
MPIPTTMLSHQQNLERFKLLETARFRVATLQNNPGESSSEAGYWQKQGDETRNELILANLGLVTSLARKYTQYGLEIDDLEQEGRIGLGKAIEKFDYRRGWQLSTYAEHWIRQAITRALSKQARTIRIPEERLTEIRKLKAVAEEMRKEFGGEPSPEEIAWEMNIPERQVRALLAMEQQTVSMHTPVGHTDGATIIDFVADSSVMDPGMEMDLSIHHKWLRESFQTLTERECEVFKLRHGIDHRRSQSLEKIGMKFGVSGERIRQIHHKAYEKVVCFIREKESSGFLKKVKESAAIKNQAHGAKDVTALTSQNRPKSGLKTRNTNANPNHNLWNNNGTWSCKFRVYTADGGIQQINKSLKTRSLEEARILRDEMMDEFNRPLPHAAA